MTSTTSELLASSCGCGRFAGFCLFFLRFVCFVELRLRLIFLRLLLMLLLLLARLLFFLFACLPLLFLRAFFCFLARRR
jgi:hypothetical protein